MSSPKRFNNVQKREGSPHQPDPFFTPIHNTYRFVDYKERVVDLLARVVTVSVRTVEITDEMRALKRS